MSITGSNTVILLFARSPEQEARVKGIAGYSSTTLWQGLLQRQQLVAERSGMPVLRIDETLQSGFTFGDRLQNAIVHAFSLGYSRVIATGVDAPDIRVSHLKQAAYLLHTNDWVIGPDQRGGTYLLGVTKDAFFQLRAFGKLPWQTNKLYHQLTTAIREKGDLWIQLSTLCDLNTAIDLSRWLGRKVHINWIKTLLHQLAPGALPSFFSSFRSLIFLVANHTLRGPPAMIVCRMV